MRQSGIAEHEVAGLQAGFLAAMIEDALPLGLEQEVEQPRSIAYDMAALALHAAFVDRQPGKLHRAELVDPQLGIEAALVTRGELALAHSGRVDFAPRRCPADFRQPPRR